jgi:hypothetical protein
MTGFEAGQRWAYAAPPEIADSRILIGAIVEFEGGRRIACCAVTGAIERGADGTLERITIPFLPLTLDALAATVTETDGSAPLPDEFASHLATWSADPRGASYFTVPFEGSLERMIGLQMAAIVEQP